MAWIDTVSDDDIPPEDPEGLRELYHRVRDPATSQLDHILQIHSLHPGGLAAHYELYRTVMTGTRGLRKVDREMIALHVSRLNQCHY